MVQYKSFHELSFLQAQKFVESLNSVFGLNGSQIVCGLLRQMADYLVAEYHEEYMRGAITRLRRKDRPVTVGKYRIIYEAIFEAEEGWFKTSADYDAFKEYRHNLSVLLDNVM